MLKRILSALILILCLAPVNAAKRSIASFKYSQGITRPTYSSNQAKAPKKYISSFKSSRKVGGSTYLPKAPYSGFGKQSKVNGQIKTKPISGYFKPSNGYKFVNPYSRTR